MERASGDVKHKTGASRALETSVAQGKASVDRAIDTFPGDAYDSAANV